MPKRTTFIIAIIALSSLLMSGCGLLDRIRDTTSTAIQEGTEAAENIQNSVENIQTNVTEKIDKVNTAVESVQNAAAQLNEAAESTKKAAEDIKNITQ